MPQDKRRSISYRSFLTCDDPKGVECGAIRKSKINSQKKEQDNNIINKVEAGVAVIIKEEREIKEMGSRKITRGLETPVSFQLLEVSKEAEKLNHVINSWSNEKKLKKNQHKNSIIAKDLLRGALELQESIAMLEKLQEASSYMMGLSRKQKQKLEEGTFDGMVSGVRGFQRPRKSFDEMRNVVRDSLLRQNMITNPVFEEHYYDHRKMGSPDMMPSTSSSTQSSMVYSSNFVPSESSVSSSTFSRSKKERDSSLIVKLMGLETFPSSPRKHGEREKILNLAKPLYDIDSPKARRPQLGAQEVGMKQRSVDEILEKLKFKGFLKNNSVNGLTIDLPESEVFASNNSRIDERMPIVVMKPLRYPCIDLDEPFKPKFQGENVMRSRYSRGSYQASVRNEAGNFSEKYETVGEVNYEEKAKSVKKVASAKAKPQKKQAEVKKAGESERVMSPTRRKVEVKKDVKASDQLSSRDQEKFNAAKIKKEKDGKSISKNQISSRQKTTTTSMLDQRKRGTSERKKNRQPAVVLEGKRIHKGENNESEAFHRKDIDSAGEKCVLPTINNIIGDNNNITERCQNQIRDYDIDYQYKLGETPGISYLPNDKKISHFDDNQSSYSEITSVSTSECCNVDQLDETQSPLHEVTLITTHENGIAVHHDTNQEVTKSPENGLESPRKPDDETSGQCLNPHMKLKALLLSNSLFNTHVEELFNIQINPDSTPILVDESDQDLENTRLLIDCANEVLELKSSHFLLAYVPLPRTYTTKSRELVTLDCLMEEVCNAIEHLRCYLRPKNDEFPSDDLYDLQDRDLRFKSGTWAVGWRSMCTQEEVEQVIGEIDKFVLGKLIEEVLRDFML